MTKEKFLTLLEASAKLEEMIGRRIAPGTIRNWVIRGEVPGRKLGGTWFVTLRGLSQYVEAPDHA
jgi:hypothetical protein